MDPPRFFMDSLPGLGVQLNLPPRSLELTAVRIPHYLKTDTHTSKAPNLLALCFSPPQGHMLADECTLHNLHRKVPHSHTAWLQHMAASALRDLSTDSNKHYLQTHFYTFKSSVPLLWFYSLLTEIMAEHFHFFCKVFLWSSPSFKMSKKFL